MLPCSVDHVDACLVVRFLSSAGLSPVAFREDRSTVSENWHMGIVEEEEEEEKNR